LEQKSPLNADRFLILLGGKQIVCPHCDNKLQKYTTVDHVDFVMLSCNNEKCKYMKNHHSHFHTAELMQGVKRKQYYCLEHRYNSSIGGCFLCSSARNFNKNIAPKLNAIFNKIMKE
jgi:aspartyl-tRNA synthetase